MLKRSFLRKSAMSLAATLGLGGSIAIAADITLNGNTLNIGSRTIDTNNALRGAYYDPGANPPEASFNSVSGIRALEAQYIADGVTGVMEANLTVDLNFDQATTVNPFEVVSGGTVDFATNDTIAAVWSGELVVAPTAAGVYNFATASDDGSVIHIDGDYVLNNNLYQGRTRRDRTGYTLSPGIHTFLIGWYEGGSGANMTAYMSGGPTNAPEEILNPSSPLSGLTFRKVTYMTDATVNGMNVIVSANSGLNIQQDTPPAFGSLTMANNVTLTVDSITAASFTGTNVGATSTFAVNGGRIQTGALNTGGAAATINKTGAGDLHLNRPSTSIAAGTVFNVQAGSLTVGTAGVGGLGSGTVNLTGGTLSIDANMIPPTPESTNGLGWSAFDTKANFDATFNGLTPVVSRSLDTPLDLEINFPRGDGNLNDGGTNDDVTAIFNVDGANLNVPFTGNDDIVARFTGKLNVATAGPTEFGLGSNDGSIMFLDLDTGPGTNWQKVADNNRLGIPVTPGNMQFRGTVSSGAVAFADTPAIAQPAVPNLSVGNYDFIVGFFSDNATAEAGLEVYWSPAGGTGGIIPGNSMSMVTGDFFTASAAPLTQTINVTANSTINVVSPQARANSVTIAPGVTLRKTGNDLTANITAGGPGTVTLDVSGRMTTGTITTPANGVIAKTGSGELVIGQLAPTTLGAGTSLDARAGRLTAIAGTGGDSLGDALVTLSGGTLGVRNDGTLPTVPVGPGLADVTGDFYRDGLVFDQNHAVGRTDPLVNGWSAFASVQAMNTALNPLTPAFNDVPINVPLNFPGDPNDLAGGGNDDEGGNIFAQSGIGVNLGNAPDINFAVRFTGKLNVTSSGPTRFTVGTTDGGVMFLDLDQGPGTNWALVVDNNRFGGVDMDDHEVRGTGITGDPPIAQIPAPNLAAGAYDFVVGFSGHNDESDGIPSPSNNEAGIEVRWTPVGGGESIIPVAARGSVLNFGNNIRATENSTIDIGTEVSAAFGDVTIDAGRTLTSTGGPRNGGLKIAGSVGGTGTLRASPNHTIEFSKSGPASSGGATLAIGGGATMRFAPGSGNTFGGSTVAAVNNDGLLHAANGITDLSDAVVTAPNPGGVITGAGLAGVTGKFYNAGLVFNQNFTAGRPDPTANGWSAFGSVPAMDAALNPLTPAFNVPINTPLNFPGDITNLTDGGTDDDPGNIFAPSGIGVDVGPAQTTNFAVRFAGKLNVPASGPTSFELLSNDGAVMFLDLDTGPGTNWATVVDNNRFSGADGDADSAIRGTGNPGTPPIAQIPAPNLTAGQYDFIVGFFNHNDNSVDGIPIGNDQAGLEVYWTPAGGGRSIIPPASLSAPSVIQVDAGATLRVGTLVDAPILNLAPTSRLELHKGTSRLNASVLNIPGGPGAATAAVDLTDADLVVQSSAANKAADFAATYADVKQGFNQGDWKGLGITSSTAANNTNADTGVTVVDNALLGLTDFGGRPVDANSLLLKYTYYGDIDQNGQVDADDLTVFASNFGRTSGATQVDGDIDFNGAVNADDLTVFANNFNKGVGAPLAETAAGVQAVPEPTSLVLAGLGAAGVLAGLAVRRRTR